MQKSATNCQPQLTGVNDSCDSDHAFSDAVFGYWFKTTTMEFTIDEGTSLHDVQHFFNGRFQYLKLEFMKRKRVNHKPGFQEEYKTFGQLNPEMEPFTLFITSDMTTGHVEELFRKHTGLDPEIFRKSGKVWLRTTATDNRTLEDQDKLGRDSEQPVRESREEADYHEQE